VVTNQQGIGRGLMTEAQLSEVHRKMLSEIESAGGRIDAIYFSPDLKNTRSFTRKPAVGMGLAARRDFPEINLQRSIMVGDSKSDLLFGKRLGMITVLIYNTKQIIFDCGELADFSFPDLIHFTDFYEDFLEINK
jgi:histidinol-phosphate phosphatase family protein